MKTFSEYTHNEIIDSFIEYIDEAITTVTGLPNIDKKIDKIFKRKKYIAAIKYYLQWREKSNTDPYTAMQQAARHMGLDFKNLNRVFHDAIRKGKLPKDLALEPSMQEK